MRLRLKAKGKDKADEAPSIEDLIALGRLEEAREELVHRLRANPRDHHSKVKLGDVYAAQGESERALATHLGAAEDYAADGFYDKAVALLVRLQKEQPGSVRVEETLERLDGLRQREARRQTVVEALSSRERLDRSLGVVEAQQLWPALAGCTLVQGLQTADLRRLFLALALREADPGEVVARQHEASERLFLVARGELVAEVLAASGQTYSVASFGPGALVGEQALLEHRPWSATYRARRRSLLLELDAERLALAMLGCENPRELLDALRAQAADRLVASEAGRLAGRA